MSLPKVGRLETNFLKSYDVVGGGASDSSGGRDNLAELIAENQKIISLLDDKYR